MPTLPTGTITFLFTDVEGSSRRWDSQRAAMAQALARHDALIRETAEAHHGYVFHTAGDAFGVAFTSPDDALATAIAAQRALAAEDWSAFAAGFEPLAVRMGLHTGVAELRDGDYFGPPLNRTARLMAAGHGGQVLLSLATQQLVRDRMPQGVALRDLGAHRLKDLTHSEHIFQLVVDALADVTTPPDTAEVLPVRDRSLLDADLLPGECPYRGLHAFREQDARFFFGREVFTDRLARDMAARPMVGVIGPSGSGKSSVVFAGLLPRLRAKVDGQGIGRHQGGDGRRGAGDGQGRAADGQQRAEAGLLRGEDDRHRGPDGEWHIATLRPGATPFTALAAVLVPRLESGLDETDRLVAMNKLAAALRAGEVSVAQVVRRIHEKEGEPARLLLVADQFEELYTLCADDRDQRRFQDLLFEAVADGDGGNGAPVVKLALTLRADFMGHAMAYRPFSDALQDNNILLGPMNHGELARAIARPAELQGRAFEGGLVERILADVGEEAGQLPLLEFALTKLWEMQQGGWLTHEAYEGIGRVEGAVARHADTVFDALAMAEQGGCRRVFVQMVRPGEGTEDTRRLATKEELGEDWALVRKLADARLVVTNRDAGGHETVEVVHEALIRSWGRLTGWMNADRAFRTWQERVRFAAKQWEATGHDEGTLLRGVPLAEAEGWLPERGGELAPVERSYVDESVALKARREAEAEARAEHERAQQVRTLTLERRGRRLVTGIAAVSLVAAVAAGALALAARHSDERSQRLRMVATSQKLLSEGLNDSALAVALEALDGGGDLPEAELAVSEAAYAPGAKWVAEGPDIFSTMAVSPDGTKLITGDFGNRARLWDAATGRALKVLEGHTGSIHDIAWLPDSRHALSGSDDGTLILWDTDAGKPARVLRGHTAAVWDLAVSPDGHHALSSADDKTVRYWDLASGSQLRVVSSRGYSVGTYLPDGQRVILYDDSDVIVWDLSSDTEVRRLHFASGIWETAVSPDSHQVAAVSNGFNSVPGRVWDLRTGAEVRTLGEGGSITGASTLDFSRDGKYLAFYASGAIYLADAETGRVDHKFVGHTTYVYTVRFSPDGETLFSCSSDKTIRAWRVRGGAEVFHVQAGAGSRAMGNTIAISADAGRVVTGSGDGTVRILDGRDGRQVAERSGFPCEVWEVALSPVGHQMAIGASCGMLYQGTGAAVQVWRADAQTSTWREHFGDTAGTARVAYGNDGSVLASWGTDGVVRILDSQTGEDLRHFRPLGDSYGNGGSSLAITPDGRLLVAIDRRVTSAALSGLQVWSIADAKLEKRVSTENDRVPIVMAVSPDGRQAVLGGQDRTINVWDLQTSHMVKQGTLDATILALAFTPDSRRLVATVNGGVGVWDIDHQALVRRYTADGRGRVEDVAVSADGRIIAAIQDLSGTVYGWRYHTSLPELLAWIQASRYVPQLTCAEREEFGTLKRCGGDGKALPAVSLAAVVVPPQPAAVPTPTKSAGPTLAEQLRARAATLPQPQIVDSPAANYIVQRDTVRSVSLSRDGRFLVTAAGGEAASDDAMAARSNDNSAALWDARSGALVRRFVGHTKPVHCAEPSPDGRFLVTCSDDKQLILWDVASGKALWQHATKSDTVAHAHFDPSGARVAYGEDGTDANIVLLDAQSGRELAHLGPHPAKVGDFAFSADGSQVLSGADDGVVRRWDVAGGKLAATFGGPIEGHTGKIFSIRFDQTGRRAVSAGDDGMALVWDVATGHILQRLDGHLDWVTAALFLPDGHRVVTSSRDFTTRVWDIDTGHELRRFPAYGNDMTLTPDGHFALIGGLAGTVTAWPLDDGAVWSPPAPGGAAPLSPLVPVLPGSSSTSGGYTLTVKALPVLRPVRTIGQPFFRTGPTALALRSLALTPDGHRALVGGGKLWVRYPPPADLSVPLWDLASGERVTALNQGNTVHRDTVGAVAISRDGTKALVGSDDVQLVLWDLATGREIRRLEGQHGALTSVAFSPDGHHAASAADEGLLLVWDLDSGAVLGRYDALLGHFRAVAFSPDGRTVIGGRSNGSLLAWDYASGADPRVLAGPAASLTKFALAPDGRQLVAGAEDGSISVWDLAAGKVERRMAYPKAIYAVAVSPDGRLAASGAYDGVISLWRLADGAEVARGLGHLDTVRDVAFTPDGRQLVSVSDDGTVRTWDVAAVVGRPASEH